MCRKRARQFLFSSSAGGRAVMYEMSVSCYKGDLNGVRIKAKNREMSPIIADFLRETKRRRGNCREGGERRIKARGGENRHAPLPTPPPSWAPRLHCRMFEGGWWMEPSHGKEKNRAARIQTKNFSPLMTVFPACKKKLDPVCEHKRERHLHFFPSRPRPRPRCIF